MAEELFKKKISREERLYLEAVRLQGAVSCVLRFERKVGALNSAAKKFEALGEYKDARTRMKACREAAAAADVAGAQEVYELALRKKREASRKSDYIDAIEEFKRLKKKDEYSETAKEQIRLCKKEIAHLESMAAWRRRLILLAVLGAGAVIFVFSPGFPFAKGIVHQQMGEYKLAIANYQEASAIPWTKDLKASCHYKLGMEKLEAGNKEAALKHFKKAGRLKAAKKKAKELEKELLENE